MSTIAAYVDVVHVFFVKFYVALRVNSEKHIKGIIAIIFKVMFLLVEHVINR